MIMAIRVTLLANEGILLQDTNTKLLIDGIHTKHSGEFSGLSAQVLADLLAGQKTLYQNIAYLLFTHHHEDHFSSVYTEKFLKGHRLKGVVIPEYQVQESPSLKEVAEQQSERVYFPALSFGEKMTIKFTETLSIVVFCAMHAGEEFRDVANYCYLISLQGKKIFIIGDSDYDATYFSEMLAGEPVDVLFVNPMFIRLQTGRKVIEAINPRKLIVYHIPFEGEDSLQFRRMVPKDLIRHEGDFPPAEILWDELQTLVL
jgi:L-ascorbate metabolism protein UlaG (beta-lactamase superfamily)